MLQQVLDLAKSQPQAPVTEAAPAAAAAPQRRAAPRADLGGRQPPATQRNGRPPKRRRAAKPWEWDRDATPPSRPAADRPAADGRGARRPPDGQRGPAARPGVQHECRRSAAFKSAFYFCIRILRCSRQFARRRDALTPRPRDPSPVHCRHRRWRRRRVAALMPGVSWEAAQMCC